MRDKISDVLVFNGAKSGLFSLDERPRIDSSGTIEKASLSVELKF